MTEINRRNFLKGALAAGAMTAAVGIMGCSPKSGGEEKAAAASTVEDFVQTADTATKKWSFEIAPDPITEDKIAETIEADVVVVGCGTSGLMVANSAAEEGLGVVVVSASAAPVARGGSNNAIYCKAMERANVDRLSEFQIRKEIFYAGNQVDERKWYKHFNNSEKAMNWVIDLMESAGYKVKVEIGTPSEDTDLYHETCSIGWDLGDGMQADPDMQLATGMMQPLLVKELARHLTEDLGGEIYFKTKGEQLVRDSDGTGRVSAVVCSREDGSFAKYVGKKAVVLATGDFSANRDMMYAYAPSYAPYISDDVYDGETNYDVGFQYGGLFKGDGQRMGLWVGAAWQKVFPNCVMGGFYGPGPRNLYSNFLGLLVNKNGERFMNEDCLSPCAGMNNFGQPGKTVFALWNEDYARQEFPAVRWLQLSLPPIYKPPVQGAFSFLGCGNLPAPWLKIRPKADYSHGRLPKMPPIELCFSLHMDRLWRKAPSFAVNRATRALKLPLSGHKDPQAAAAGGLPSETDGLERKEPGFGNGQQGRGIGARVRARGVHGAGQGARACALLPVPGEAGGLAPRGA